jgi:hypothetical protein
MAILISLNPLAINAAGVDINKNTYFFQHGLASKKKPPIRIKKPLQGQYNCEIVRGDEWQSINQTVSVGLKAFTALYSLGLSGYSPSYLRTCKIIVNSRNLRYTYALPDNSRLINVKISAFIDGKIVTSINLNKGGAETIDLNISDAKSFAISVDVDANTLEEFSNVEYIYIVKE